MLTGPEGPETRGPTGFTRQAPSEVLPFPRQQVPVQEAGSRTWLSELLGAQGFSCWVEGLDFVRRWNLLGFCFSLENTMHFLISMFLG